jgi:hypothetical protein
LGQPTHRHGFEAPVRREIACETGPSRRIIWLVDVVVGKDATERVVPS